MEINEILESGLLERYVLGDVSREEVERVHEWLRTYPELKQHVSQMEEAVFKMSQDFAVKPSEKLKHRIMRAAARPAAPTTNKLPFSRIAAIVLLPLLALVCLFLFARLQQDRLVINDLKNQYEALDQACADIQGRVAQVDAYNAFIRSAGTKPVYLEGTALSRNSSALVYWNAEEERALLTILELPVPDTSKQYQLWADIDGEMVSVAVLDHSLHTLIEIPFLAGAESLNITLEPFGGSEHPNVDQLYLNGPV